MFEARLSYGTTLKKILESIKDLLENAVFDCSPSGIQLQAMDNTHAVLVFLDLKSSGFNVYRCERIISMGVNLNSMSKIFKGVGEKESVTLRAQGTPDTMTIIFDSPDQNKESRYEMRLMDLSIDALEIPETEYSCTIRLPSAEFLRICRDLSQFGEEVVISCTRGEIKFAVRGDIASGTIKLKENMPIGREEESVLIEVQNPVSLKFSCQYLNNFTKATPLSSEVRLSLSTDLPLVVEYRITDIGYIRFYLASKL